MSTETLPTPVTMETIVALCKRRGFIFQSSDIYGGINGFFDYGPLGSELRRNIKEAWWHDMVHRRDDMVGIDSSIIMHRKTWEASGHLKGFSDPMVDCKESKNRYRADHLFYAKIEVDGETLGYISILESENMQADAEAQADNMKRKASKEGKLSEIVLKPYNEAQSDEYPLIPSPHTSKPGSLTPPRDFNLMFKTYVGALEDASATAYLRPETAQGIFVNFKNVTDTTRVKLPFGIAQIGKAFRNEITPRNFIFRSREFEQMEIEYFIPQDDESWEKLYEEWIKTCWNWLLSIGIRKELLGREIHPQQKLAHYSRATTDLTFKFPFGEQELEGISARGCYDLTQHQNASGKSMELFDESTKAKYIPHVIEPSIGVDRLFLAVICSAYCEDAVDGKKRTLLKFHPRMAPYKAAVFPLVKNKSKLVEKAQVIYKTLQRRWNVFYDDSGVIGRRYRRMDEIGTPFGITIDFDTLEDGTITIRDRDTTNQERIPASALVNYLDEKING